MQTKTYNEGTHPLRFSVSIAVATKPTEVRVLRLLVAAKRRKRAVRTVLCAARGRRRCMEVCGLGGLLCLFGLAEVRVHASTDALLVLVHGRLRVVAGKGLVHVSRREVLLLRLRLAVLLVQLGGRRLGLRRGLCWRDCRCGRGLL